MEQMKRILDKFPEEKKAWTYLGRAHSNGKEYEQALACAQRAVGLDLSDPHAMGLLGRYLNLLGRNAEAEKILRMAVGLGPTNASVHFFMAAFLKDQQRIQEALPMIIRATELWVNNADYWNLRGTLHWRLKQRTWHRCCQLEPTAR